MFPSKEGIDSIKPENAVEELPHVNHTMIPEASLHKKKIQYYLSEIRYLLYYLYA